MSSNFLFSLSALIALLPAAAQGFFGDAGKDARRFWLFLSVAMAGTMAWLVARFSGGWHTGFAESLWLTIGCTLLLYAGVAYAAPAARGLSVLLQPYLAALGLLGLLWEGAPERALAAGLGSWTVLHIALSILAYGFATLAAVAASGVILRERALKAKGGAKAPIAALPSIADGERLQTGLLTAAAITLAAGIVSGMATEFVEFGSWLPLNHKVVFSLGACVLVLGLLLLHIRMGLPGRRAARLLLAVYLLLSLAYPGVKFVTDVLIAAS